MFFWTLTQSGKTVAAVPFDPNVNQSADGAGISLIFHPGRDGAYLSYSSFGTWMHRGKHVQPGDFLVECTDGRYHIVQSDEFLAMAEPASRNARRWLMILEERERTRPFAVVRPS